MANSISGFYQTLVAGADEASRLLAPTHKAIESIYVDFKPAVADLGQTVNVQIPNDPTSNVADAGTGDLAVSDIGFTSVPIVFNKHPQGGYLVRDFEQFNTPADVRRVFLDALLTGIKNNINSVVTGLFTTGNFTTNAAIATTGGKITTAQFLNGMQVLLDQNVPAAGDPDNMALLVGSTPYTKTVGDDNWTQAQIAGTRTAEFVRQRGEMPVAYGCTIKLDQQMPKSGTAPNRTFTGAYLHRHAVALVSRPLPRPDERVVEYFYMDFGGISVRVMFGYNQLKGGYVVTVDAGYGVKVVRENMGQLFSVAE